MGKAVPGGKKLAYAPEYFHHLQRASSFYCKETTQLRLPISVKQETAATTVSGNWLLTQTKEPFQSFLVLEDQQCVKLLMIHASVVDFHGIFMDAYVST